MQNLNIIIILLTTGRCKPPTTQFRRQITDGRRQILGRRKPLPPTMRPFV